MHQAIRSSDESRLDARVELRKMLVARTRCIVLRKTVDVRSTDARSTMSCVLRRSSATACLSWSATTCEGERRRGKAGEGEGR